MTRIAARVWLLAILAALVVLLCGCPAKRHLSGTVYDGARVTSTTTGQAFSKPLYGAKVTWSCPSGGPPPQSLTTDGEGHFVAKDLYTDMPGDCELQISMPGYDTFHERFDDFCDEPRGHACSSARVAVQLRPLAIPPASLAMGSAPRLSAIPTSAASAAAGPALVVVITKSGSLVVDGVPVPDEAAVQAAAKAAVAKSPGVTGYVTADPVAQYSTVIHIMDVLRSAGVTRISFTVLEGATSSTVPYTPGPPPPPEPSTTTKPKPN